MACNTLTKTFFFKSQWGKWMEKWLPEQTLQKTFSAEFVCVCTLRLCLFHVPRIFFAGSSHIIQFQHFMHIYLFIVIRATTEQRQTPWSHLPPHLSYNHCHCRCLLADSRCRIPGWGCCYCWRECTMKESERKSKLNIFCFLNIHSLTIMPSKITT